MRETVWRAKGWFWDCLYKSLVVYRDFSAQANRRHNRVQLRGKPASCPVPHLRGKIGLEICVIRRNVVREKPQYCCRKAWKLALEIHQLYKSNCHNTRQLIAILRFKSLGSECFFKKNSRLILAISTDRRSQGVNHKNCGWMLFKNNFHQKSDH
jgi:hypothetical protein